MAHLTKYVKHRDAWIALSMANIMFLRVWRELLFVNDADGYWMPDYTSASYAAAILNVTWITVALLLITVCIRKTSSPGLRTVGRIGFLLLFIFPLEYLRTTLDINEGTIHWCFDHSVISGGIGLGLAAFSIYLFVCQLKRTMHVVCWVLLALVPFAFVTLGQAAFRCVPSAHEASEVTSSAPSGPRVSRDPSSQPRIIWLLFDELDSRLAFMERPRGVLLPNFDRLRAESVVALDGASHGQSTCTAIPSFLTGRIVSEAKPASRNELLLRFLGDPAGQYTPFAECETLFGAVRARRGSSAVTGIYHPYHRLLGQDVDDCSAYTINTYTPIATDSVWTEACSQLLGITPLFRRINSVRTYKEILKECLETAGDPYYDVVYVHVSVPHGPTIYDRKTGEFTLTNISKDGYLDNLVLADSFLSEVRRSLEEKAMWDESVIVITSDHELRRVEFGDQRRVAKTPLMIKMPGQQESFIFEEAFSPKLVTKDLLLAVLDGELKTPSDVVLWMNR